MNKEELLDRKIKIEKGIFAESCALRALETLELIRELKWINDETIGVCAVVSLAATFGITNWSEEQARSITKTGCFLDFAKEQAAITGTHQVVPANETNFIEILREPKTRSALIYMDTTAEYNGHVVALFPSFSIDSYPYLEQFVLVDVNKSPTVQYLKRDCLADLYSSAHLIKVGESEFRSIQIYKSDI